MRLHTPCPSPPSTLRPKPVPGWTAVPPQPVQVNELDPTPDKDALAAAELKELERIKNSQKRAETKEKKQAAALAQTDGQKKTRIVILAVLEEGNNAKNIKEAAERRRWT
jgi:hypothetical protein